VALAQWASGFYAPVATSQAGEHERTGHRHSTPGRGLAGGQTRNLCLGTCGHFAAVIKEVLSATGLKMPQLAMAVRVLLLGTSQTPSLDAVIELFLRETVLERLRTG
jgi:glutamyl-tRNA synthetase